MSSDFTGVVQIRKWALALVGGVPTLATLTLAFTLGQERANFQQLMFDSAEQKREIISKVYNDDLHWTYEELDSRYMPKTEVTIYLSQIQANQQKIMKRLDID
jgi:hypothetical protein